jgi:heme o synthase
MENVLSAVTWRDYLAVTKPRVVLLHLVTACAAMVIAARGLPAIAIFAAVLVGGGLVAGASNVLNCYFDQDIDRIMVRTRNRPLPSGRMSAGQALAFGVVLAFAGVFILDMWTGWAVATLAVGALVYYVLIYTLWLKRQTYWSSIIGSGAGAFPPLIGWVAVTGRVEVTPFILFALIVFWTPPHFWPLAMFHRQDYRRAGLGVIPGRNVASWIMVFACVLILFSFLLMFAADMGIPYLIIASILGAFLLVLSLRLRFKESLQTARHLYVFSIFYLVVLFGVMIVERLVS